MGTLTVNNRACGSGVNPEDIYSVLFIKAGNPGVVYSYFPDTTVSISRFTHTHDSPDIAHTRTKLWLYNGLSSNDITEYNVTLGNWSNSYNRTITNIPNSAGLAAIDDTHLVCANNNNVYECDITGNASINTLKFSLPVGAIIRGDFFVTTNRKFVVTYYYSTSQLITRFAQYNYDTGAVEITERATVSDAYGLYEYDGYIYMADAGGALYRISNTTPYGYTFVRNLGFQINGASQLPEYLTVSLT